MKKQCVFDMSPQIKLPSLIYEDKDIGLALKGVYGIIATMSYPKGVGYLTAMACTDMLPARFRESVESLYEGGLIRVSDDRIYANPPLRVPSEYVPLRCTPREMCQDMDLPLKAKGLLYTCLYMMDFDGKLTAQQVRSFLQADLAYMPMLFNRGLVTTHSKSLCFDPEKTTVRPYGVPVRLNTKWAYESFVKAVESSQYTRILRDQKDRREAVWIHKVHWVQSPDEYPTSFWLRIRHYISRKHGKRTLEYSFFSPDSDPFTPKCIRKFHKAIDWIFPHIPKGSALYNAMDQYLRGVCSVVAEREYVYEQEELDNKKR